jgi:hypothetical protein
LNSQTDEDTQLTQELLGSPSPVMRQYLEHFASDANTFISGLSTAMTAWNKYYAAKSPDKNCEAIAWSQVYFLNTVNCALISTRLFLSGYLVASGNQSRQAVESLAFGILLPFPKTGAYRRFAAGHSVEHKSMDWLVRNADHCGTTRKNVEALRKQAKFFDMYSHPSRLGLASAWGSNLDNGFALGAVYVPDYLPQYRKEMANRLSLTKLINGSIRGTQRELLRQGLLKA